MININKESSFDLKQFSGVAAFSERISCKFQLPYVTCLALLFYFVLYKIRSKVRFANLYIYCRVELLNNLDGQKEVIESADFFALSWKLDGIHVSVMVSAG